MGPTEDSVESCERQGLGDVDVAGDTDREEAALVGAYSRIAIEDSKNLREGPCVGKSWRACAGCVALAGGGEEPLRSSAGELVGSGTGPAAARAAVRGRMAQPRRDPSWRLWL